MKEYLDFHKLIRLSIKKRKKYLLELLDNNKTTDFFKAVRISNVLIEQAQEELDKFYEDVKKRTDDNKLNEWNELYDTVKLLRILKMNVYESNDYLNAKNIQIEDQLVLAIISTEIITRYTNNIKMLNPNENIEMHNYFKIMHTLKSIKNKSEHEQGVVLYESIVKGASDIIKYYYLDYKKMESFEIDATNNFDVDIIMKAINHHISADKFRFINDLIAEFQFSNLLLKQIEDDGKIQIGNDDSAFIESYNVYKLRNKTIQTQHEAEFLVYKKELSELIDSNTREFPIKKGRSIEELFSYTSLAYHLFTDDLDIECQIKYPHLLNIDIKTLLRAYTVITQMSNEHITRNKFTLSDITLENTCIVVAYEELVELFVNAGIKKDRCYDIIDILTFNRNNDIVDCPLIRLKESIIIIPSISAYTMPYLAIMSRVDNFEFQGISFESTLISKMNKSNIGAFGKKINDNNVEYQCDLMFALDDDLYICECKAWGDAFSIQGYYEQFLKKYETAKQLNRIADFYTRNLNHIRNDLKKDKAWEPKKVHKIMIINNMIGDVECIDDVRVIDYSYFDKFLKREKPALCILNTKLKELKGFACFEGNITRKRMNDFLYSNAPIRLQKARLIKRKENVNLLDTILEYETYIDRLENYRLVTGNVQDSILEYIKDLEVLEKV